MRSTLLAALSCFAATVSLPALAGPAELPEEELFEYADVVADVEVVSLACDGDPYATSWSYDTPYVAELEVRAIHKGDAGGMLTYRVTTVEPLGEEELSCEAPEYVLPAGWVGRVYLHEAGHLGYWIADPGGAVADPVLSDPGAAPNCMQMDATAIGDDPEDPGPDPDPAVPAAVEEAYVTESAGCAMSGTSDPGWAWALLAGAAFVVARRRR